jgi:3'-phosphoadenosine 5'-phosphosulfate sulfotransferase (PAPS reductase)/FAD synthetase
MNKQYITENKIPVLVSFSGGKDSTALALFILYESGIPKEQIHIIFADTGWEHHYTYWQVLKLAEIHPVQIVKNTKYPSGMSDLMFKTGIPIQKARFCTQKLKVEPIRKFQSRFEEYVSAKGIRKEEGTHSNNRGDVGEFELDLGTMMYSWYPIRDYTLQDVWDIHDKYAFPRNKLYELGFSRVGCMPCIFARKAEIVLANKLAPENINIIRKAEQYRNFPFFSPSGKQKFHNKTANNGKPYADIDNVLKWANMTIKEVRNYEKEEDTSCSEGLCE